MKEFEFNKADVADANQSQWSHVDPLMLMAWEIVKFSWDPASCTNCNEQLRAQILSDNWVYIYKRISEHIGKLKEKATAGENATP